MSSRSAEVIVIGAGPGGLYLSILLRLHHPETAVRVLERTAATHETFGFGVAFHEVTLRALAAADPVSRDALDKLLRPWDDVVVHRDGHEHRLSGHAFAGCSRHALISMLRQRATELGAVIEYDRPAMAHEFPDAGLVVVADGSSSQNRAALAPALQPHVVARPNRFVWLGTERPMAEMNFFFRTHGAGVLVAHAYPHQAGMGTWIVETDETTFHECGLDGADETRTVKVMEQIFAADLDGAPLVARDSFWRRFPLLECRRWTTGNVALVGDSKATVHYSLGSGTKIAMEDAVALTRALDETDTVRDALTKYEAVRMAEVETLQRRALGSMQWFESVREHWSMTPARFAFSGITRKTDETFASVQRRGSVLAQRAISEFRAAHAADPHTSPLDVPCRIGEITLPGRVVGHVTAHGQPKGTPDLALSHPVTRLTDLADAVAALQGSNATATALVVRLDPPELRQVVDQAEDVDALIVDLGDLESVELDDARRCVAAAAESWRGLLGLRLRPVRDPVEFLPLLTELVRDRCQLLMVNDAPPNTAAAPFMTDYFGRRLGVTTICGDLDSEDIAVTALVSGRTDLVVLD